MGWLKPDILSKERCVREGGRWSSGWSKLTPRDKTMREGGRASKGRLKHAPNKRVVRRGRWSMWC